MAPKTTTSLNHGKRPLPTASRAGRIIVDVAMVVCFIVLLFMKQIPCTVHQVGGISITVLLIVHVWQHRKWFKALTRGKWKRKRIAHALLNLVPLVFLIITIVLGFAIPDPGMGGAGHGGHHAGGTRRHDAMVPHHFMGYITAALCAIHAIHNAHLRLKKSRPSKR